MKKLDFDNFQNVKNDYKLIRLNSNDLKIDIQVNQMIWDNFHY